MPWSCRAPCLPSPKWRTRFGGGFRNEVHEGRRRAFFRAKHVLAAGLPRVPETEKNKIHDDSEVDADSWGIIQPDLGF